VARGLNRGEIWLCAFPPPNKRRPVLIIGRQALLSLLNTVTVVPITSTIRGAPTEVVLGIDDGLKGPCCANLTHIVTLPKERLVQYVGTVRHETLDDVCEALAIAVGCD